MSILNIKGKKIIIDDEDFDKLSKYKWYFIDERYYCRTTINKKNVYIHRMIMNFPKGKVIDHINGNILDNRKENLRIVDKSINGLNRKNAGKRNTSGYRGVSIKFGNKYKKWLARIYVKGKVVLDKTFYNKNDASVCVNSFLKNLGV